MKFIVLTISCLLAASVGLAQDIPFETNETTDSFQVPPEKEQPATPPAEKTEKIGEIMKKAPAPMAGELGALGGLAPFNDIAVIQKRFLPKTKRFEFYPNVGLILNDAFFTNTILGARISYYFRERYGVEVSALMLGNSEREVTKRLKEPSPKGLETITQDLVAPRSYYGAAFKWTPIYGKIGLVDKSIIPFDFYFLLGGGVTKTNQDTSPPTVHVGTGQIFAISKWVAARWDLSWFFYNSSSKVADRPSGSYNNLHATIGLSFFFPEAEYR